MANPQPDKYTKISNELLDALCKTRISGEARQILDVVFRKTYGFGKSVDTISLSQFEGLTGMPRPTCLRGVKKLEAMNIIVVNRKKYIAEYSIQKNYETWDLLSKKITVSKGLSVDNNDNKFVIKNDNSLENGLVIKKDGRKLSKMMNNKVAGDGSPQQSNYTGRVCAICGMEEKILSSKNAIDVLPYLLHQHHIEWEVGKNNVPKSDKSSDTILVCYKCHRDIHKLVIKKDTVTTCYQKSKQNVIKKDKALDNNDNKFVIKNDNNKRKKETITKETLKKGQKDPQKKENILSSRNKKFIEDLEPYIGEYSKELLNDFYRYWSEPNRGKTKMRFELERTWDLARRLTTWSKNEIKWETKKNGTNGHSAISESDFREMAESIANDPRLAD